MERTHGTLADMEPVRGTQPGAESAKQMVQQNVRWELKLTYRQKVNKLIECMKQYDDAHSRPTETDTTEAVQEYMRNLEKHTSQKLKQIYRRAGQEDHQSLHKDGWSLVFIG